MEGDLGRFFLKTNKSAVENAMKLAENDDENVVKLAENAVENAKKLAENDDENVVLKNINNLNLIG
jgi:cbb3-type cytochrome oxidase subunit 3